MNREPILVNYKNVDEVFDDWHISKKLRSEIKIITATTDWGDDQYDRMSVDIIYYLKDKIFMNLTIRPIPADQIVSSLEVNIQELLNYSILEITKDNIKEYFKSVIAFI